MLSQYIRINLPKSPNGLSINDNRGASSLNKRGMIRFRNLKSAACFAHNGTHHLLHFRKTGYAGRDNTRTKATFLGNISNEVDDIAYFVYHLRILSVLIKGQRVYQTWKQTRPQANMLLKQGIFYNDCLSGIRSQHKRDHLEESKA